MSILCPECGEPLSLVSEWSRTPMLQHEGNLITRKCHYSRMAIINDLKQIRGW